MEDLSVFLLEQGLEDYEESIRAKGVSTPSQMLRLTEADVELIIPNKPIHARKLAALVRGRRLSSSKFTVDMNSGSDSPGGGRRPSMRTPTPTAKEGLSPQVKKIISVRGEVARNNARKPNQVIKAETMTATIAAFDEMYASGERMSPQQALMLVDRHIRTPFDKRLVALCGVKCITTDDPMVAKPSFWVKIDSAKCKFSPAVASIFTGILAVEKIATFLKDAQEKQSSIQANLEFMKTKIPKQKRRSILQITGDALKKSSVKDEKREKEAEAFRSVIADAAMVMQERFRSTVEDWTAITKMQYDSDGLTAQIKEAIATLRGFNGMALVEGEMDGDLQMMLEEENRKVQASLEELQKRATGDWDMLKNIFNTIQGVAVHTFIRLAGNSTFRDMINDDEALQDACGYRIVVPYNAVPGANVLRVPIVKGAQISYVDVPVPDDAVPGQSVLVVPSSPEAAQKLDGSAEEGKSAASSSNFLSTTQIEDSGEAEELESVAGSEAL
uniref:SAM domain-containing protein n=1 Tax=Rhizochromulina marina TaxID=1034831 RepID=A0A7S2WVA7_9STRA